MTFEDLKAEALRLDIQARAKLAHDLLSSLEDLSDDEVSALWDEEARRREQEIDRNPSILADGEQARASAFGKLPAQ